MNLLELTRLHFPKATFIFTSTNKVYGDTPNQLNLVELETRYEALSNLRQSPIEVNEHMSIDHCKHSIFGASKVAADIMVQEYGKYFNLKVGVFRGGCLTGSNHKSTELHGFLSYLIKCIVTDKKYTIIGYKGKQVRDNIHSEDLLEAFWLFYQNPKYGEVYNIGGGRENSISILETINLTNKILNKNWSNYEIDETNRIGDHIWYITDLSKFKNDYPKWSIKHNLTSIINSIIKQNI